MFSVHVKNGIGLSRVREKTQVGLEPKYQTKFEGVDRRDKNRYDKNYMLMMGQCENCVHFVKALKNRTTGEHCVSERCVK